MNITVRENLIMRNRLADDAPEIYQVIDDNRAYLRQWLPWVDGTDSPAVIQNVLAKWDRQLEQGTDIVLGIFMGGKYIGNIGLHDIDKENKNCIIGYWLAEKYQGQGIITDCVRALINYAFEVLELNKINIHCALDNCKSRAIPKRLGFHESGILKDGENLYGITHDMVIYCLERDEWEAQKEIEYYNALPCEFNDFIELPELSDGEICLVCTAKRPAIPEKKFVPAYDFAVCKGGEKIGEINLRIGYTDGLYYGGQIGYGIDEKYRGNGYAGRACRLIVPVAKAHCMTKLLITNNQTNDASRRVCEKLGARLVRVARLPEWHDLYKEGRRFSNIFEWSVE